MTAVEVLIRALNGVKSYNLHRGNKRCCEVSAIRRTESGFKFKITTGQEFLPGLIFEEVWYEIPEDAIQVIKKKITTQ